MCCYKINLDSASVEVQLAKQNQQNIQIITILLWKELIEVHLELATNYIHLWVKNLKSSPWVICKYWDLVRFFFLMFSVLAIYESLCIFIFPPALWNPSRLDTLSSSKSFLGCRKFSIDWLSTEKEMFE